MTVNSTLICKLDLDDNLKQVDSCSLEVSSILIGPKEIKLFEITRDSKESNDSIQ
jgi:hypothetical protein